MAYPQTVAYLQTHVAYPKTSVVYPQTSAHVAYPQTRVAYPQTRVVYPQDTCSLSLDKFGLSPDKCTCSLSPDKCGLSPDNCGLSCKHVRRTPISFVAPIVFNPLMIIDTILKPQKQGLTSMYHIPYTCKFLNYRSKRCLVVELLKSFMVLFLRSR